MTEKVDITPVGCKTPEGIARVNAAVDRINDANARCAELLEIYYEDISASEDAKAVLDERKAATEELLRALAGRPAR